MFFEGSRLKNSLCVQETELVLDLVNNIYELHV